MPQFIGRPRFFEELSQMALQMQAQNPIAQALGQGLGGIGEALGKRGMMRQQALAKSDLMTRLQAMMDARTTRTQASALERAQLGVGARLTSDLATRGMLEPYQPPVSQGVYMGPGSWTPEVAPPPITGSVPQGELLSGLLSTLGVKPSPGAPDYRVTKPKATAAEMREANAIPWNDALVEKFRPIMGDTKYWIDEGIQVSPRDIVRLESDLAGFKKKGVTEQKGQSQKRSALKYKALQMAKRETEAAQKARNSGMYADVFVPTKEDEFRRAEQIEQWLEDEEQMGGGIDPGMRDLFESIMRD